MWALECLKVKLPRYRHTVAPTHFQKQVGRGTWLVKSMQESKGDKKMQSQAGEKGGLRMVLDLHSNLVSFGTLNQDYNAFKLFIGQLEEFPALKQRSIRLEPGREHFVELSAKVDKR